MRYIESTYRDGGKSKQWLFEVEGETPTEHICKFIYRGEMIQNPDAPHYIRKVLVGDGNIYRIYETKEKEEQIEQISIFDLLKGDTK